MIGIIFLFVGLYLMKCGISDILEACRMTEEIPSAETTIPTETATVEEYRLAVNE